MVRSLDPEYRFDNGPFTYGVPIQELVKSVNFLADTVRIRSRKRLNLPGSTRGARHSGII
jgi:hypothetical protein